jgi:hypothetical protein
MRGPVGVTFDWGSWGALRLRYEGLIGMVVSAVRFGHGAPEAIQHHVLMHSDRDVGGVLVGGYGGDGSEVIVTAAIPALDARRGGTDLTFGRTEWQLVHRELPRYVHQSIVGWYRSRRASGELLTDKDILIHQRHFSGSRQVALVIDPHTWRQQWFGWSHDEVVPIGVHASDPTPPSPIHRYPRPRPAPIRLWPQRAACALLGVGIGSAIWFGALRNDPGTSSAAQAPTAHRSHPTPQGGAHPIVVDPQAGVESGAQGSQTSGGG